MNLFNVVDQACKGKTASCTVHLGEIVTNFDWDRVAFVKMQAWAKDPASAIGIQELKMDEFEDLIVFANGNKAVHTIRRDYDPEIPFDRTIFLNFADLKTQWQIFPKAKAKFNVQRLEEGKLINIDLAPIEN